MRIGFIYDILENVFAATEDGGVNKELATELFSAGQANELISALKELGHQVIVIDGAKAFAENIAEYRDQVDFVFNEAKGLFGHDRKMAVPALCRIFGIPCLGSDAYTVTLARNKWHTLAVAAICGMAIPQSVLCEGGEDAALAKWTQFPAIVKPNYESASIGISDLSVVHDVDHLRQQVQKISDFYLQSSIVQEFVSGIEIQISFVGTVNPKVVGVTEIRTEERPIVGHSFLRSQDWLEGKVEIIPYVDEKITIPAATAGSLVYRALGIRDYGRIDFRVTPAGVILFIEASTHPHITLGSSFEIAARMQGWHFTRMVQEIINSALQRQ